MFIAENVAPFVDEKYVYEMKWDGERCVAYLGPQGGTELRNKRNVRMLPKVPELSEIHRQVKKRCILDGELLCLVDGKPSFEMIQRRSLMSNRYRIELEVNKSSITMGLSASGEYRSAAPPADAGKTSRPRTASKLSTRFFN